MDRMLHRGVYTRKGEKVVVHDRLGWRNLVPKLLGINSEYTRGDKVLAWSVFIYSMGWMFGSFVVLVIWNTISPWPDAWWAEWFKIQNLIVPGIIGVVTSIWFTIGGTLDIRRLFRRLDSESQDALDDGRVIGHLSADDVEAFAETEREQIKKPDRKDQP